MKYFFYSLVILICCCTVNLSAQTGAGIDKYIGATIKLTTIGSTVDNLSAPQDLDFSPVPSRKNELWVVNKGDYNNGGSVVIFYDAGKPTQHSEYRHDSHSAHFMLYPSAIAMGDADSGYFATCPEALNSVGNNTSTFMGPVLWDSDTTKFAVIYQNNWVSGQPLGSHIDMLHQSPYSMGIAYDTLNMFWVFDGYHSCLYHYDFVESHGYGNDDHSNGKILKYKEVKLKRIANTPSHMVADRKNGWLYIVDNGNKRIVRVNTRTGSLGNDLTAPNENLQEYAEMTGVKWETIDSGFTNLSGIDYFDGRLIVGNYGTGEIRIYNTTTSPKPKYLGSIQTADIGMMGLKIGPDTAIWYVNRTTNRVTRLTPGGVAPAATTLVSPVNNATQVPIPATLTWTKTTGATTYHLQLSKTADFATRLFDSSGLTGTSVPFANLENSTTYYWRVSASNAIGEGKWSAVWHYKTLGAKPEKPVLISPTDGTMNTFVTLPLTWDSLKMVTAYNLQVSVSSMFATTVLDESTIVNTSYNVQNLGPSIKYYWRIRGLNDGAIGDWSEPWSFTTRNTASVSDNTTPSSKITIDPIYPNPSSSNSSVNFLLSESMQLKVSILDLTGNEVMQIAQGFYESGKHRLNLNSVPLSSGMYFYQFSIGQEILRVPFVIKK